MNRARLVVLMIVLATAAGCGKKGSLYLPKPPPANAGMPATAPTASNEPAAPAATPPPAP